MSITLTIEQLTELIQKTVSAGNLNTNGVSNTNDKKQCIKYSITNMGDRYTLDQFIEKMEFLDLSMLLSYNCVIEYYYKTITKNLDNYTVDDMPFICCDYRRKKFLWNDNGVFTENTGFLNKLMIHIERHVIKTMHSWKDDNNCYDPDDDEIIKPRNGKTNVSFRRDQVRGIIFNVDKFPFERVKDKLINKLCGYFKDL